MRTIFLKFLFISLITRQNSKLLNQLNKRKFFKCAVFSLLLLSGCASPFLEKDFIMKLDDSSEDISGILFYEEVYDFTNLEDVRQSVRIVFKTGSVSKNIPDILNVTDYSIFKLESYNARILDGSGVKESFSRSDLSRQNLSSSGMISTASVYFLPINNVIKPGDIIETYAEFRYMLPELGVSFSKPPDMLFGSEYRCIVKAPSDFTVDYNSTDFPAPEIIFSEDSKMLIFRGMALAGEEIMNPFAKKESNEQVYVVYPVKKNDSFSWNDFGNWYYNLFNEKTNAGIRLKQTVSDVTKGLSDDVKKLEAIFNYCQRKIRYEQVYLELGEFIPNDCNNVLERGYGDCKDYAVLIHSMAKAAGINTTPALCFRGRGIHRFENIPVHQFNHVIVHYENNGKEYWLDGTNRDGIFGTTTSDLINQNALLIKKGKSEIRTIKSSANNKLVINGTLNPSGTSMDGDLIFNLSGQYAADFYFYEYILSKKDMTDFTIEWVKDNISSKIIINKIGYQRTPSGYELKTKCTFPNSITRINSISYFSILQTFTSIIPQLPESFDEEDIFYYPGICGVEFNVELPHYKIDGMNDDQEFQINNRWNLDPGPYTSVSRKHFLLKLKDVQRSLSKKYKLKNREQ